MALAVVLVSIKLAAHGKLRAESLERDNEGRSEGLVRLFTRSAKQARTHASKTSKLSVGTNGRVI